MAVNTTWSSPATAGGSGGIDLAAGDTLSETVWDRMASDLYRLGGTDGNAKTGALQIGSTQTYSNASNTAGLTVNQGAADDECLSLKSSDVAHGMTAQAETDTYSTLKKANASGGGLLVTGLDDGGGVAYGAITLAGMLGQAAETAKSIGNYGVVRVSSYVKSGTTAVAVAANGNLVSFDNAGTSRFFLDADGDSHQDVGTAWTNFSDHDDVGLLNIISAHVTRSDDPLRERFRGFLDERREQLEELRLVTFNDDGHHFVNMSRLTMLLVGAAIQTGRRIEQLERRLLPAGEGA